MSENICKDRFKAWQKKMKRFSELYNRDTNECAKYITGFNAEHCAYRYIHIHGAVERMGGFANFKYYVNKCAQDDYETFKTLQKTISELQEKVEIRDNLIDYLMREHVHQTATHLLEHCEEYQQWKKDR